MRKAAYKPKPPRCVGCDRVFGCVAEFAAHVIGNRCGSDIELRSVSLRRNHSGIWAFIEKVP